MNDPKNMSRENLEKAFEQAKTLVAQQQEIIKTQHEWLDVLWNLNYGNNLQIKEAKEKINEFSLATLSKHLGK